MIESWAIPTWLLFHALAEKINETFLKSHTSEVLQMIKNICHNLPCPHCRHHATAYMRSINVSHINSREKIKDMFYILKEIQQTDRFFVFKILFRIYEFWTFQICPKLEFSRINFIKK